MFRKILLPLDLTDKHEGALRRAQELVLAAGGEITLLHVVERIPGLEAQEDKQFYERLEKSARKHLQRLGRQVSAGANPAQIEIRLGNRAAEVVRFAQDVGCDLIVLTCPKFDPDSPAPSWGSMSWKISLLANCPVLLVK
jgi:universal stress protein A